VALDGRAHAARGIEDSLPVSPEFGATATRGLEVGRFHLVGIVGL